MVTRLALRLAAASAASMAKEPDPMMTMCCRSKPRGGKKGEGSEKKGELGVSERRAGGVHPQQSSVLSTACQACRHVPAEPARTFPVQSVVPARDSTPPCFPA